MSYLGDEQSVHDSEPIELYEFTRGVLRYTYTSATEPVTFNSAVFKPVTMQRTSLESSGELGRAGIVVTMPRDIAFLLDYRIAPPSEITTLTIYRKHRNAPDSEALIIWMGRILSLKWPTSTIELNCEPIFTSMRRLGLRRQFSRNCGHVLYGPQCGVNATAYKGTGEVTALVGNIATVTIAGDNGNNYYSGGYVQYEYDNRLERKMILRQIGLNLTLSGLPVGLTGGMTVEIFPGCDHTLATCKNKFANTLNYGGFPWIPTKNPFNQIALW
jgi:uncharacterized phage protein (TIGR02218 family)